MRCTSGSADAKVLVVPNTLPADSSGEFVGWGTSLAWFAHAIGTDSQLLEAVSQALFSRDGLGLNIVRYNIGGSDPNGDDLGKFRAGGAVPCCYSRDGSFDPEPDAPQTAFLLRARELIGRDAFYSEAFCNSPPYWMCKSGTSRGHTRPYRNNLGRKEVEAFAASMLAALAHFKEAHGLVFDSLSPFNEPGSPAWIQALSAQEGCYFSHARMNDVIRALQARKAELGRTIVSAHEQFCISDASKDVRKTPAALWPAIGKINTHTYDSSEFLGSRVPFFVTKTQDNRFKRASLRRRAAHARKEVWVSEFGTGKGAEALARHVMRDLATLLPTAWVYWQAVEEPGSTWGLVQAEFPPQSKAAIHAYQAAKADAKAGAAAPQDVPLSEGAAGREAAEGAAAAGPAEAAAVPSQRPPPRVIFTPQYHVVRMLARALPRGARVFGAPPLARRGVGVWLGEGRAAYVLTHPAKTAAPLTLTVDARALLGTQGGGGGGGGGGGLKAAVTLLDAAGLDAEAAAAGDRQGDVGSGSREVVRVLEVGPDGIVELEVPPGHLAAVVISAG